MTEHPRFCSACGTKLSPTAKFCSACGARQETAPPGNTDDEPTMVPGAGSGLVTDDAQVVDGTPVVDGGPFAGDAPAADDPFAAGDGPAAGDRSAADDPFAAGDGPAAGDRSAADDPFAAGDGPAAGVRSAADDPFDAPAAGDGPAGGASSAAGRPRADDPVGDPGRPEPLWDPQARRSPSGGDEPTVGLGTPPPAGGPVPGSGAGSAPPPAGGGAPSQSPPRDRFGHVAPGAGELAQELKARLNTPGVISAAIIGAIAAAACLVGGLVTGLVAPSGSFIHEGLDPNGQTGAFARVVKAAAGIAGGHQAGETFTPVVLLAIPVAAAFFAARLVAPRLTGLTDWARIGWSAAGSVVFALLMAIVALIANGQDGVDLAVGTVLLGGLVLALLGIVPGAVTGARAASPERDLHLLPARWVAWLRLTIPALRALGGVFVVSLVVALLFWTVQSLRGDDFATGTRSVPGAVVENVVLSPDFAVSVTAAALLAQEGNGGASLPGSLDRLQAHYAESGGFPDEIGIFSLDDRFAIYVLLPLLLVLLGTVVLAALYAGFATSRRAAPATPALAAAYGALTGPVWALTAVAVRELTGQSAVDGGGLFLWSLLLGGVFGALGGFLSAGGAAATRDAVRSSGGTASGPEAPRG